MTALAFVVVFCALVAYVCVAVWRDRTPPALSPLRDRQIDTVVRNCGVR